MVKHTNPTRPERTACAPYNFVPLPEHVRIAPPPLAHDRFWTEDGDQPVFSGWFDCTLTTETPCFIRGPMKVDDPTAETTRDRLDFFSIDEQKTPRIPASSLRGLFRMMTEIISNARFGFVTDRKLVYRAFDTTSLGVQYRGHIMESDPSDPEHSFTPRVKAGFIRKGADGEWYIQPAKQTQDGVGWCRISHDRLNPIKHELQPWPKGRGIGLKSACLIYVKVGKYELQDVKGGFLRIRYAPVIEASATPKPDFLEGVLLKSGHIDKKRHEAVILAPDEDIPPEAWLPLRFKDDEGRPVALDRDYLDQLTEGQKKLLGDKGVLQDMHPVFYLLDQKNRLLFFGHTLMMRLPYRKSIADHIPAEFRPQGRDDVDLAESIFGYTRRGRNRTIAHAGRVSFTDGLYAGNLPDPFEREITPRVLSTPKPTTFQHYLCQPNPDDKAKLLNYNDDTPIRGYKLYWNRGEVTIDQVEEGDEQKLQRHKTQYTRIKAVKKGADFTFRIYFDNLRPYELGALAWILLLASDPHYRLKLGMAKPYGMGAVSIRSTLNLVDRRARYTRLFDESGNWAVHSTLADTQQIADVIQAFKHWVTGGTPQGFEQQLHIRELFAMLSWPGPEVGVLASKTRYMEIERRDPRTGKKLNEYRDRPVLPHPSGVQKSLPSPPAIRSLGSTAGPNSTQWLEGVIVEIRPDKRYGVVQDAKTQKRYRFDIKVVQGNMPGKRMQVKFQLNGEIVTAVKRA